MNRLNKAIDNGSISQKAHSLPLCPAVKLAVQMSISQGSANLQLPMIRTKNHQKTAHIERLSRILPR